MAAGTSFQEDILYDKLRQCLNRDTVKLWLPPYTTETGEKGEVPGELINRYSKELDVLDPSQMSEAMEHLRLHALEKLAARKKFKESGLATVKVRLAGNIPEEVCIMDHWSQLVTHFSNRS